MLDYSLLARTQRDNSAAVRRLTRFSRSLSLSLFPSVPCWRARPRLDLHESFLLLNECRLTRNQSKSNQIEMYFDRFSIVFLASTDENEDRSETDAKHRDRRRKKVDWMIFLLLSSFNQRDQSNEKCFSGFFPHRCTFR